MLQQVHLQNGLLGGHGLDGKALGADDVEIALFLGLVRRGAHGAPVDGSALELLLQAGLVFADLPLDGGAGGVHRGEDIAGGVAHPVKHAVVLQRDLGGVAAPLPAEGDERLARSPEETVDLAHLFLGVLAQIVGHFYLFGRDGKLHTRYKGIDKKVTTNGVIDEKVYSISTDPEEKTSIALSKNGYAELILSEDEFSDGFDFSEFQKIFDVIKMILSDDTLEEGLE